MPHKHDVTDSLEAVRHELLVVDHFLPSTSSLRVVRDRKVGLETHRALVGKRVGNLGGGLSGSRWESLVTPEEDFKEDLGVESERSGVERNGLSVVNQSI